MLTKLVKSLCLLAAIPLVACLIAGCAANLPCTVGEDQVEQVRAKTSSAEKQLQDAEKKVAELEAQAKSKQEAVKELEAKKAELEKALAE